MSSQEDQIKLVLKPIFLEAKSPLKCIKTSAKLNRLLACAVTLALLPVPLYAPVTPHSCSWSSVRLQDRLYLLAMNCNVSTTSTSLPSPTNHFGVS